MWSVGHAKGFGSEFESHSFPYGEVAEYSCIEVEESGASELVTPHVAEHAVSNDRAVRVRVCAGRLAEGRRIEPQVGVDAAQHVERGDLNMLFTSAFSFMNSALPPLDLASRLSSSCMAAPPLAAAMTMLELRMIAAPPPAIRVICMGSIKIELPPQVILM